MTTSPNPTLALCIPAFNAAWCLPRLLELAGRQSVPFDEILVYDDGSTDDTIAVAEAHGARVIRGGENRGCSFGKNRLAEAATSDWLHFHDADDLILPHFVETIRGRLELWPVPDVLLLNFEYRDAGTDELISTPDYDVQMMERSPIEFVLRHKVVNFGVYRKSEFLRCGGFDLDPAVLYNEDAAFHLRLALAGATFGFEPEVTSVNLRYQASMSASNQQRCFWAQYHVLEKAAVHAGPDYHSIISERLWEVSGAAGSVLAWEVADRAAGLAAVLGGRMPRSRDGLLFKTLAAVHPPTALRVREGLIRGLRPHLRKVHRPPEAA